MAQYDGMPGLAWVYRPQLASYAADASPAEQAVQLEAALQRAVKTSLGGKPPTRVFYDVGTGDAAAQRRVMLLNCLKTVLPAFDLLDIKSSYHLTERLGDLGAAGVFAGVALASMAAWETGGTALVINLLRDNGATVMAVRPSEAVYRQQFGKRPYEAS